MDSEKAVRSSSKLPRWPGGLLAGYALVCGVMALASATLYPPGWGVLTRPMLGGWAIAGGLLLLLGDPWWKPLLRLWTLAQTAIILVDASGDLTLQPGVRFALQRVSSTTVGDQVMSMQGYGVNLGGLLLFALTHWIISRKWHPQVPERLWQFQALRVVRLVFLAANLAMLGFVGWRWLPVFVQKDRLLVIDCPWPGAEIYLKERRLGTTPLVVTHDNMVSWGLSKPSGPQRWDVKPSNLNEGFVLTGNSGSELIHLKAPWWCEKQFAAWPSEWGLRAVPQNEERSSNRCVVRIVSKAQPGLVLFLEREGPKSCRTGEPVEFVAALRRNPPGPRITTPAPVTRATNAELAVTFMKGSGYETQTVPLSAEWSDPASGVELKHAFKVQAPKIPGKYAYRIQYRLSGSHATGGGRTYGVMEVK